MKSVKTARRLNRRTMLKTVAGAGAGSVLGAPMIWAQSLKDVTLMHVGPSYSIFEDIPAAASADLGFKIEMQNAGTDAIMARVVGQPDTIDIADLEFWAMQRIWRSQKLQSIDTAKIANWNKIIPLFREGKTLMAAPCRAMAPCPSKCNLPTAPVLRHLRVAWPR